MIWLFRLEVQSKIRIYFRPILVYLPFQFHKFATMKNHFAILRTTRNNILNSITKLSVEQLNKIPEGYNNNIIWNVAHVVVTQQLLIYKLSGVLPKLEDPFIDRFKKGTEPSGKIDNEEIEEINTLLVKTVDWLEEDYAKGVFKTFNEYSTSYGYALNSTNDAILFNNVHEGLHFGYIMAMKKLV